MIIKQTSCICCLSAVCAGTVCCAQKGHTFLPDNAELSAIIPYSLETAGDV